MDDRQSFSVHWPWSFYSLDTQLHCYESDCFLHYDGRSRSAVVGFVAAEVEGVEIIVVEEANDLSVMTVSSDSIGKQQVHLRVSTSQ